MTPNETARALKNLLRPFSDSLVKLIIFALAPDYVWTGRAAMFNAIRDETFGASIDLEHLRTVLRQYMQEHFKNS